MNPTLSYSIDSGSRPIEMHPSDLYCPKGEARTLASLDCIDQKERRFYAENGYLAVANVFSGSDVEAACQGIKDLVLGARPDFKGIQFEAAAAGRIEQLDGEERVDAMRKLVGFVEYDERLKRLAHHPDLLKAVRFLLGDREPVLQADQALSKPPRVGREKPWHQDLAFFNYDPLTTPVVGVWIALDPVDLENGCMQLLPGRHREGPILHFKRRDWQICDRDVQGQSSVAAPLPPGGALFFDGLLPHGTPHNNSNRRRRALQFHYIPAGTETEEEVRLRHFGSEGKGVEC